MASKLQKRLTGTIFLVALVIIVVPKLLDGQKKHYRDEFAAIPLLPKLGDYNKKGVLSATDKILPIQFSKNTMNMIAIGINAKMSQTRQVQENKFVPTDTTYIIQLGALKNIYKVNEIVSKLRKAGYYVYTAPSISIQGKITRILIGPDVSKDKLKSSLKELKQISGMSGVVIKLHS